MSIEELKIEDETQLEEVERFRAREDVPLVNVNKSTMYFNKNAKDLLSRCMKWYTTAEYIIAVPCDPKETNSYLINTTARMANIPSHLKSKKIKSGTYRLYKYKDGFAFKRYE